MEALSKAYNGLHGFIDQFANTTSDIDTSPRKTENRKAWYAEWDDNYMGDLLDNHLTKSILRKVADFYYGEQLDKLIDDATELDADSYPALADVYASCCETLGIYLPPKSFITGKIKGINAISLEVEGDQLILISPKVASCLTSAEQAFLLGHELGHHQQGNLVCHTVNGFMDNINNASAIFGPLLLDAIEVPLKRWCRCTEFNADRAGYICCNDPLAAHSLFQRLGMNSEDTAFAHYKELETAHPLLSTRWEVLKKYIATMGGAGL